MKTIRLYGDLRKRFGYEFKLDVATPAEALRALCAQVRGFRSYFYQNAQSQFKVFVGPRNASQEIGAPCSDSDVIRVTPVIQGAGGVARIILGIIIAFVNWYSNSNNAQVYAFAASLILGGVIELLSPTASGTKSSVNSEKPENTPSYNFNGPVNTKAQGHPAPICYGKMMVGSAVISAGLVTV